PVTADMLAHATSLKVIARSGVGYDSIDVQAAAGQGIRKVQGACLRPKGNEAFVATLHRDPQFGTAARLAFRRCFPFYRGQGRLDVD
ncbi:hypothetical protein SB724_20600, partial [Bacillus sp. SIMBA_031]